MSLLGFFEVDFRIFQLPLENPPTVYYVLSYYSPLAREASAGVRPRDAAPPPRADPGARRAGLPLPGERRQGLREQRLDVDAAEDATDGLGVLTHAWGAFVFVEEARRSLVAW